MDAVAGKRSQSDTELQLYDDYLGYVKANKWADASRRFKDMTAHVEEDAQPTEGTGLCGKRVSKLRLEVRRGTQVLSRISVESAEYVEPHFSPDGSRIVWVLDSHGSVRLVPTQGPQLSITASKQDLPGARKLARDLEKKGFVTTRMTIAQKERDNTVVYAKPEAMQDAQALATSMNAKVEPINWETKAQVVLALAKGSMK